MVRGANTKPHRLYTRGKVLGYRRSHHLQNPSQSLVKIEGVNTSKDVSYYLGKRVVWVYKGKTKDTKGSRVRSIWGRITGAHGNSGVARAKFAHNLPARALGASVRVMLYPSSI
eukprot:TRINITY_DN153_c0_g1_i1.p1 TRINITY_DN153_c0_g1~~TRINITY_DN153_c0_g1_i1.p1  ORF type:complete len:114 (+),score=11.47 TRINITY_DN153_c0_g1_i1:83-424(+)